LRANEAKFRAIVEDQTEMIVRWKPDGIRTFVNPAYSRIFGRSNEQLLGKSFFPVLSELDRNVVLTRIHALTPANPVTTGVHRIISPEGELLWQEWTDRAIFDERGELQELQSTGRDITKRKQAEQLNDTQRRVLEMIARGRPLLETLDTLLRLTETLSPEMICSILFLDPDGVHVRHGAAPSLPAAYLKAIDGSAIGPRAGSCGTAAFRREPVFVEDIATDALWEDYRRLALPHGLRACWSTPIFDAQRHVLGTFAIYYRKPALPNERHRQLIDMATHTAAICISKFSSEQALRESEERYRALVEFSPDCVAVTVDDRLVYLNPAGARLMQAEKAEDLAKLIGHPIYDFVPPERHERMRQNRNEVRARNLPGPVMEGPLIRLDGSFVLVEGQAVPCIYDGRPAILSLIRDITERKHAEAERQTAIVREREAREQFTRQLIASQEAERTRIAAELHDSLGQNLVLIKNRAQLALAGHSTPDDSRAELEGISGLVTQAIAEVRQISHDLHPYQLDHLGLTRALTALIDATAKSSGLIVERRIDSVDDVFSADAATDLYRIVQESLNNILKHASAKSVHIELERDVREVQLTIRDDGCGFVVSDTTNAGKGLGLMNIAERVRILRGRLQIDSNPGAGTVIEVIVPIEDDEEMEKVGTSAL
jgi:PAS domain S-box-containing protein